MRCTDGAKLSNAGLVDTPLAGSGHFVLNGVEQKVGDGVKTTDMYFSGDGGNTAKALSAIVAGDIPYLNAVIAQVQVFAGDAAYLNYRV